MEITLLDTEGVRFDLQDHSVSFKEVEVFSLEKAISCSENDHVSTELLSNLLTEEGSRLKIEMQALAVPPPGLFSFNTSNTSFGDGNGKPGFGFGNTNSIFGSSNSNSACRDLQTSWYHKLKVTSTTPANNILKRLWERFNGKVSVTLYAKYSPSGQFFVYKKGGTLPETKRVTLFNLKVFSHQLKIFCLATNELTVAEAYYSNFLIGMPIDSKNYACEVVECCNLGVCGYFPKQHWKVETFTNDVWSVRIIMIADILCEDNSMFRKNEPNNLTAPQRILDAALASDVIIVAENGAEIKAHKCFLYAWSTTFQSMFQSGMEESQTGRLDMSDMSEEGIMAFLRCLYYEDLEEPKQDVGIAYEVLYAAHKYEVNELEEIMVQDLLNAADKQFEAALAFKMYSFVRNIESAAELKSKMIRILKMKLDEVKTLREYKELFQKNPDGAMELCEQLAKATLK